MMVVGFPPPILAKGTPNPFKFDSAKNELFDSG